MHKKNPGSQTGTELVAALSPKLRKDWEILLKVSHSQDVKKRKNKLVDLWRIYPDLQKELQDSNWSAAHAEYWLGDLETENVVLATVIESFIGNEHIYITFIDPQETHEQHNQRHEKLIGRREKIIEMGHTIGKALVEDGNIVMLEKKIDALNHEKARLQETRDAILKWQKDRRKKQEADKRAGRKGFYLVDVDEERKLKECLSNLSRNAAALQSLRTEKKEASTKIRRDLMALLKNKKAMEL